MQARQSQLLWPITAVLCAAVIGAGLYLGIRSNRLLAAQSRAAQLPDIEAIARTAVQGIGDPQEAHRRMVEAIYSTCDQEFGARYRAEAIRRADELVANAQVPPPRTIREGYALMRQSYAEIAARADLGSQINPGGHDPPASPTVYVTRTGECYHRGTCSCLRQSRIPMALNEARDQYRACSRCRPPR